MKKCQIGVWLDNDKNEKVIIDSKKLKLNYEETVNGVRQFKMSVVNVGGFPFYCSNSDDVQVVQDFGHYVNRILLRNMSEHTLIVDGQVASFDKLETLGFEVLVKPDGPKVWAIDSIDQIVNELNMMKSNSCPERVYAVYRYNNVVIALFCKGNIMTGAIIERYTNGKLSFKF